MHRDIEESGFFEQLKANEAILHKLIALYAPGPNDKYDLHQEMLLQLWKSFSSYKGNAAFSTWMYKVCLNTALTYLRKESKHQYQDIENLEATAAEHKSKESHDLLYSLIRELPEVDRMLISLYLDGYKNIEIADITGVNVNNVNVKIHRIKNKLSEGLKRFNNE